MGPHLQTCAPTILINCIGTLFVSDADEIGPTIKRAATKLILRRASRHRPGYWSDDNFDVVDDEGRVGRIVLTAA